MEESAKVPVVEPRVVEVESPKETSVETSNEVSNVKPSPKRGFNGVGCAIFLIILFCLFVVCSGVATFVFLARNSGEVKTLWDRVRNTATPTETIVVNGTTTKVLTEESVIIDVVRNNEAAVVTIAISNVGFDYERGVIDRSSNIGTGFVVDANGLILTNQHVVENLDAEYKVVLSDGTEYDVESIARDDANDVALLKIDADGLQPVRLGNSDNIVPGQMVIAVGTPLGSYAGTVTSGIVSGTNRTVSIGVGSFYSTSDKEFENVIQTDAAINPGNSGGPMFNSSGEVVGINFATSSGADNISFALPINIAKKRIDEYRSFGKFIKPYLGVQYSTIREIDAAQYEGVVPGALVLRVSEDSPASKAGLQRRDIITQINGADVKSSFLTMLQSYKGGDVITLKVYRGGNYLEVKVTLEDAE